MTATEGPAVYAALGELAAECAREAGEELHAHFGRQIRTVRKGDNSVVTDLDAITERGIVRKVRSVYPDHTFIGEELTPEQMVGRYTWVVDPIDGTRNFAAAVPMWAVSVGVLHDGTPVAGAIHLPVTGELFTAVAGEGAWLDGERLSVATKTELSRAVAATDLLPGQLRSGGTGAAALSVVRSFLRTRMLGSVCCALAYVAAGRMDLYYRPHVHLWDVAAGVLLVREAGGAVLTLDGEEWRADAGSIVAANPALAALLAEEIGRWRDGGGA